MNFYNRLTRDRYHYTNSNCSFKFIDFMNTDNDICCSNTTFNTIDKEIARIIQSVFSYCKYEPYNPYVFHKVVPSARNIHPNEAFLIQDGSVWRFNSKSNNFETIGYDNKLRGKVWVVVASELWRIMKFYGEFGLALSLLDAGHILAELKMKLVSGGYDKARIHPGAPMKNLCRYLGFSKNSACINYVIDLSHYLVAMQKKDIAAAVRLQIKPIVQRKFQYDEEISRYPMVIQFLQHQENCSITPIAYSKEAKRWNDVLKYEVLRNSGHSTQGLFSTQDRLPEESMKRYALRAAGYIKDYLGDQHLYRVCFIYRNTDGEDYLMSASGKGITSLERLGTIQREDLLHDSFEHINMNSIPLNVIILYTWEDKISEAANIYKAHMGAGEISQYISLMAAGDGLFARPMKNFHDENLAQLLNCDNEKERIIYTTVIGKENHKGYILYL